MIYPLHNKALHFPCQVLPEVRQAHGEEIPQVRSAETRPGLLLCQVGWDTLLNIFSEMFRYFQEQLGLPGSHDRECAGAGAAHLVGVRAAPHTHPLIQVVGCKYFLGSKYFLGVYKKYCPRYDGHWRPYSLFCSVCFLPYNFILHFENIEQEEARMAAELGAENVIKTRSGYYTCIVFTDTDIHILTTFAPAASFSFW